MCIKPLAVTQAPRLQQSPALKPTSLASDLLKHEEEESPGLASIQSLQGWLERVLPHGGCTKVHHLGRHPSPRHPEHPWAPCCSYHVVLSWKSIPGTTVLRPHLQHPFLSAQPGWTWVCWPEASCVPEDQGFGSVTTSRADWYMSLTGTMDLSTRNSPGLLC